MSVRVGLWLREAGGLKVSIRWLDGGNWGYPAHKSLGKLSPVEL